MDVVLGIRDVGIEDDICPRTHTSAKRANVIPYLMTTAGFETVKHRSRMSKGDSMSDLDLSSLNVDPNENGNESFFSLKYKQISDRSPDYKNVNSRVKLEAGSVIVFLRPETIYGLTEILLKNFFPKNIR